MLLVIDVGNSQTVIGLYEGEELAAHWRVVTANYRTSDEIRILFSMLMSSEGINPAAVSGCCIASVVPQLNHGLAQVAQRVFNTDPLMVGPGIKTGLVLQVDNPKEVGADRIVNAVGAMHEYDGALIVIDLGTATTLDAVSAKHEWKGGVILPGLQLSADALFERCAKLPQVEIDVPPNVIGRDTVTNIRSGLTYGYAEMLDGLARRMAAELGDKATVVATGGLAGTIATLSREITKVDPYLTLKGLRAVWMRNQRATV